MLPWPCQQDRGPTFQVHLCLPGQSAGQYLSTCLVQPFQHSGKPCHKLQQHPFCPTLQSIEPSWYKPWPEAGFGSSACLLPAAEPSLLDLKYCSVCHPGSSPAQGTLQPCWRGWMLGGWTWAAAATHAADLLILLLRVSRGCQGLWCQHVLNRQWGGQEVTKACTVHTMQISRTREEAPGGVACSRDPDHNR